MCQTITMSHKLTSMNLHKVKKMVIVDVERSDGEQKIAEKIGLLSQVRNRNFPLGLHSDNPTST